MGFVRTDLAMENIDRENICPGTDVHQWENGDIQITEVIIRTEEAARQLGKNQGNYLTLECPPLAQHDPDAALAMANLLGEELSRLIAPSQKKPVLVIGLGNHKGCSAVHEVWVRPRVLLAIWIRVLGVVPAAMLCTASANAL